MLKKLRMPNTFVLLFSLLVMIAAATWFVPGGKYETHVVNGKTLIDPGPRRANYRYDFARADAADSVQ